MATVLAVALAPAFVACTQPNDEPDAEGTKILNVQLYASPNGQFSPLAPFLGADAQVQSLIFDSLLRFDENFELIPGLAESYTVSEDATVFTFVLREDIKWSDGEPFTIEDVIFTYNALANPATGSVVAGDFATVEGVEDLAAGKVTEATGFRAEDDSTFSITLTEPNRGLLGKITTNYSYILPAHILADLPVENLIDNSFTATPSVGMGPYKFIEYKTGQYVELAANENYRDPVDIDRMFLKTLTSDVATVQLGTGEIDLAPISPTDLTAVEDMKNVSVSAAPSPGYVRMAINQEQSRFSDVRVRQAILHAIDREALVETVLGGNGEVQNSSFYKGAGAAGLDPYAYDPEKAEELLAEASWVNTEPVELIWIPGTRDRDSSVTVVAEQLSAVGIDVELRQVDAGGYVEALDAKNYDLALFGGGNYATDPDTIRPSLSCLTFRPPGANSSQYCNEDLDGLFDQAMIESDDATRLSIFESAAIIDNADVPYLWLYNPDALWAHNDRLEGFINNGDATAFAFWNAAEWKLN